jgi:hypothetical protein
MDEQIPSQLTKQERREARRAVHETEQKRIARKRLFKKLNI